MFTGIISEIGLVEDRHASRSGVRLRILAPEAVRELTIDKSVAVNGVCLTVVEIRGASFVVEAVEETLSKTTLGSLETQDRVNLELPMKLGDRLDGHIVLGHVDTVGIIENIRVLESSRVLTVQIPREFMRYCIRAGSIAIDGISLTVARLMDSAIEVSIIPHTLENTIVRNYSPGDNVNLEFDVIGKYAEKMMRTPGPDEEERLFLTEKHLREMGF